MARKDSAKTPWKQGNPREKSGTSKALSPGQKAEARARARRSGRPYPNLVDNMAVARKRKSAKTAKKKAAKKTAKKAAKRSGRKTVKTRAARKKR